MPTPPRSLDSLPFDVFYQIATSLDDRDFINLSRTNRAIHTFMGSDIVARKTVENVLRYGMEGRAAVAAQTGYRKAVGHRFDIHEAVATASPYSVSILAYAADFLYHQGVLCYQVHHQIRVLNVHGAARQECVLNLHDVLPLLVESTSARSMQVSLLHYSDGILVFRLHGVTAQEDSLVTIDVERRTDKTRRRRLLFRRRVPSSVPILVRHSRSYLWYGTLAAADGSEGTWTIIGVDLTTLEKIEFSLPRVIGGDLGQTLCFEMYQEHLYAVSTQSALEEEEDFSSFYYWICLTPRHQGRIWNGRLWRREHREGPINEMWSDLSIHIDDTTGQPVILECRREWRDGKSENHRTCYTQPLPTPAEAFASQPQDLCTPPPSWTSAVFDDDQILKPAMTHQPNDERPEKRLRRSYHAEYEPAADPSQRQEFIAARTKHRAYHLAAATFIDLVNDPVPAVDNVRPRDRLRLRTVSRKRKSPIDEDGIEGRPGLLFPPTQRNANGRAVEGSEERFVSRGVHLWPDQNAPAVVYNLLCPDSRMGAVRAVSDDRSLLYSVSCPGLPLNHQALVLISFDPAIRFPFPVAPLPSRHHISPSVVAVDPPPPLPTGSSSPVQDAPALYLALRCGYWLR